MTESSGYVLYIYQQVYKAKVYFAPKRPHHSVLGTGLFESRYL